MTTAILNLLDDVIDLDKDKGQSMGSETSRKVKDQDQGKLIFSVGKSEDKWDIKPFR